MLRASLHARAAGGMVVGMKRLCRRTVLATLALPLLLGCGPGAPPPSAPSKVLGQPLPQFRRRTVGGAQIDTALAEGRVTVVKFFAKYCEPCKKTLPEAQRLHRDNPDVVFIGVALDEYESDVAQMIEAYGLSFPVVHDSGRALVGKFKVADLPVTFVTDRAGTIRWVLASSQGESDLGRAVAYANR